MSNTLTNNTLTAETEATEGTQFLITEASHNGLRTAPVVPDAQEDDQPEDFSPDTPEKADWVLGRIADARARAARIRENMELMAREAEREADFFEWKYGPALQAFLRAVLGEGGRRKSVRLPNGSWATARGPRPCPSPTPPPPWHGRVSTCPPPSWRRSSARPSPTP